MTKNKNTLKKKRIRRTKEGIKNALLKAFEDEAKEKGIAAVSVVGISKRGKIEPPVIYNRFTGIEDMLELYMRRYDTWYDYNLKYSLKKLTVKENLASVLSNLVDDFASDEMIQKVFSWELEDRGYLARRTASMRGLALRKLVEYFQDENHDPMVDIKHILALLMGGIYYIILHRKTASFCEIDFTSPAEIEKLKHSIEWLVDKIYVDEIKKKPTKGNTNIKEYINYITQLEREVRVLKASNIHYKKELESTKKDLTNSKKDLNFIRKIWLLPKDRKI